MENIGLSMDGSQVVAVKDLGVDKTPAPAEAPGAEPPDPA